jgi:hypothetical protein
MFLPDALHGRMTDADLRDGGEHEVPSLLTVNSFHLYHQDKFISTKGPDGKYTRQQASKLFINRAQRYFFGRIKKSQWRGR